MLDRTPFYAEGGGQLADQGVIELANGARVEVHDVQSPLTGVVVHQARVVAGEVTVGDLRRSSLVDVERRRSISRAHTATHMVHKAFREALGETATQAGSENAPGPLPLRLLRLRRGAVTPAMADVEARVNDLVLADLAVHAEVMTQAEAVKSGAMALFGEKYGDEVRVVSVGDWARELCGGTHAGRSGQLGVVKLLGESSIGSGVRRVEALVGGDAYRFLAREHVLVAQLTELLKVRPEELPERVSEIARAAPRGGEGDREGPGRPAARRRRRRSRPPRGRARRHASSATAPTAPAAATSAPWRSTSAAGSRATGRPSWRSSASSDGKPAVVVATNDAARARGLSANALVRAACGELGGNGGGKDDVAQGGGTDASGVDRALAAVRNGLA